MRAKIIAVDFDGTLIEEGKWPGIGATNEKVLDYCKSEQAKGARIILWTNRVGEPLEAAVKWCENNGLRLDAVNENLQESIDFFGFNTRSAFSGCRGIVGKSSVFSSLKSHSSKSVSSPMQISTQFSVISVIIL